MTEELKSTVDKFLRSSKLTDLVMLSSDRLVREETTLSSDYFKGLNFGGGDLGW